MHHTMCRKTARSGSDTHTHTHSPNSAKFRIGLFINNTIVHWVHSWVCSRDHLNYADLCPSHTHTHTHTHIHTKCIQHTFHSHHMHTPIGTNRLSRPFSPINLVGNMSELLNTVSSQKKEETRGKGILKCAWINLWWRKPRYQEHRTGTSQSTLLCIQIGTCGAECRLTWVWLLWEDAGIYLCQICQWVIYASCTKTFLFFTLPAHTQLGEAKSTWNQNRLYFLLYIPGLIRHDSSACYSN